MRRETRMTAGRGGRIKGAELGEDVQQLGRPAASEVARIGPQEAIEGPEVVGGHSHERPAGRATLPAFRTLVAVPLDETSAQWLADLGAGGAIRHDADALLHQLLLRAARAEVGRRSGRIRLTGV